MVELNETQLAIYNYSSEHTLKETCEHFQKREHQVKYIIEKKKKLDLINNPKHFIPVKIVDDASHDTEVTVTINSITIKASLKTLKALLGVTCDWFK